MAGKQRSVLSATPRSIRPRHPPELSEAASRASLLGFHIEIDRASASDWAHPFATRQATPLESQLTLPTVKIVAESPERCSTIVLEDHRWITFSGTITIRAMTISVKLLRKISAMRLKFSSPVSVLKKSSNGVPTVSV